MKLVEILVSLVSAIKSVGKLLTKLKINWKNMKTKIKKIIYKTKLVWNMGGLKQTRWIGQREP
jgi:hypothetical protein